NLIVGWSWITVTALSSVPALLALRLISTVTAPVLASVGSEIAADRPLAVSANVTDALDELVRYFWLSMITAPPVDSQKLAPTTRVTFPLVGVYITEWVPLSLDRIEMPGFE